MSSSLLLEAVASYFYHDREFGQEAVKLLPNEYFVTARPMVLTTVLGSCVAACLRDPVTGIGGMNHFMLPEENQNPQGDGPRSMRYGTYAMEVLIEQLVKAGAQRNRLEAKVFGGGAVLANMSLLNIGERNADFILRYMDQHKIRVVAQDLKGQQPRRVNFFPATGKVLIRKLARVSDADDLQRQEQQLLSAMTLREARLAKEGRIRSGASVEGMPAAQATPLRRVM